MISSILRAREDVRNVALVAFFASLLLSLFAVIASDDLNRDGMLYVEASKAWLSEGWEGARSRFDWLFMPIAIATLSLITGLEPETAGYLLCALLMGATCALMVLVSERLFKGSAWMACIVVLAMPAFNEYRDHIIREFGFWCFTLIAILCALNWLDRLCWRYAIAAPTALVVAAAFRVEAVVFLPVLFAWQLYAVRSGANRSGLLTTLVLQGGLIGVAGLLVLVGGLDIAWRVESYWPALDLAGKAERFDLHVQHFQTFVLPELAHHDAYSMLVFALLSLIPFKFMKGFGFFLIPLLFGARKTTVTDRAAMVVCFFLAYCMVLVAFVSERFFLSGRYVSYLNLLAVPVVAVGCIVMIERWRRVRWFLVAIMLISMVANVISLSDRKLQFKEAGEWLKANSEAPERVFIEGLRVRYHYGFSGLHGVSIDQALMAPLRHHYDLFVLEWSGDDAPGGLPAWLARNQMELVKRFDGPGTDVVVVKPLVR